MPAFPRPPCFPGVDPTGLAGFLALSWCAIWGGNLVNQVREAGQPHRRKEIGQTPLVRGSCPAARCAPSASHGPRLAPGQGSV